MADGLGGLFGKGGILEQIVAYNAVGEALSAALAPELQLLTRAVNKLLPATPLTPDALADMVVRNIVSLSDATSYARESGIQDADFARMVHGAGEAPSPEELVTALRRGVIPHDGTGPDSTSFQQGIAEGRLFNKWRPVIEALANVPISPADAVDAVVKNQITLEQGTHFAFLGGVSAEDFRILVETAGNPPGPAELNILYNRGLIPLEGTGPGVLSVQQGIAEGRTRNEWFPLLAKLAEYVPPPRVVTTLIKEGTISDAEGLALFRKSGLTDDLAHKYLASAHFQKATTHKDAAASEIRSVAQHGYLNGQLSETQYRDLLKQAGIPEASIDELVNATNLSKQLGRHTFSLASIKKLRQDGEIDDAQALQRLLTAGWAHDDAQTQIDEWINEARVGHPGLSESRILAYLASGIIDKVKAYDLLTGLGVNSDNARFLVENPQAGPIHKAHGSTAGDIVAAYKDDILTQDEAQAKLVAEGDTVDAAALKLRVASVSKNRGPKVKGPGKALSEAHILEAFRLGFASDTWAMRELGVVGYSDAHAALLVAIEESKAKPQAPPTWTVLT